MRSRCKSNQQINWLDQTFEQKISICWVCYIVLHRCCHTNLTLDNDTITLTDMKNGKKIPIEKHAYDKDREFYIAHLSQQLTPGKNNEKISQSKYTQFCIKGLLMVRDFWFWAVWAAGPVLKKKFWSDYEQLLRTAILLTF